MNYPKITILNVRSGLLSTVLFLSFAFSADSQNFLSLKTIVNDATPAVNRKPEQSVRPSLFEATPSGGKMETTVRFRNGNRYCTSRFRFEWNFSRPVDKLYKGQPVTINYKITLLSGACPSAKARMITGASMGFSPAFKSLGIRYGGGLDIKPVKWIEASERSTSQTYTSSLYVVNPAVQDAVFRFIFDTQGFVGSEMLHYEVVYVYEKGDTRAASCDPDMNCHNLYSLGISVGFAEYGALMNAKPQIIVQYLDGAITHANASKCMPVEGLKAIRQKIMSASSSNPYYNEITRLRNDLAIYAEKYCNCCK